LDQELRNRLNRDATKMTNELGVIRSGHYYEESTVLEVLHRLRGIAWDLILLCEYPQMKLWENSLYDRHSTEDKTERDNQT
jgi:hypothetical protein